MSELYREDIVEGVRKDYDKARNERRALELQWRLNMNYLAGNQYCEISANGDIEDYGKQYFWQEREVYNHIAPIVETRLAKLGRVKAGVSARPASPDDCDVKSALLATNVLKAVCEECSLSEKISEANRWGEICGSAFYKVVWNSDKGMRLGEHKGEEICEGDVEITVCPPYEIYPDSIVAERVEDCRYIMHAKAYTTEEIKDIWGVDVKGETLTIFGRENAEVGGGLGYSASYGRIGTDTLENAAIVIEKYERPSKAYPNGRIIIVAENQLLYYGDLPYAVGAGGKRGFPFVRHVSSSHVSGFFGVSLIERIIPLQRSYNSIKNRKHEFLNRIAMGVLAVEDGSVDTENLEEDGLSPGKVLVYRQGCNPPRMLEMGSVPDDFTIEEQRLRDEIMQIAGVSEFMRYSTVPTNMTSGVALNLLQEQDDTRISITAESIRRSVKKIGQYIIRLYRQYADNSRVKRIAGESGKVEEYYFKGSDLTSDDIVFDTENELTDTLANRRNMALQLINMGLLNDENGRIDARTRVKILEMMGLGNWESGRDIDEYHRDKAMKENIEITSKSPELLAVDNHEIHIAEHIKEMLKDGSDKRLKDALSEHIAQHRSMMEYTESEYGEG